MTVYTTDGLFSEKVDYPKGQPENPMTLEDLSNKFYECGRSAGYSNAILNKVKDIVLNGNGVTIAELMDYLS